VQRHIIILFCALMCASMSAWAGVDSLLVLQEVTVTAARRQSAVIPVQSLEGSRLQALETHSVADALRYFSGVQIKDYGGVGGLKTVDIRSMGSHHLAVMYDGIVVSNAQNGVVDLGKFSIENLESLTLYNGQRSDILMPARDFGAAGTLYLNTKRPTFKNGKSYHIAASMAAGSFGLAHPSILYEQKLTDNIHLSVNAAYTYATGRYHFRIHKMNPDHTVAWDTTGVRQNGDVQAVRAEVGLFGYLPEGKWHVKAYYYDSERGIPRAIVRNVWTCSQRQWDRNAFVQGNWTQTLVKGYDISVSAKYANDYMRYLNPDTTLMYVDNKFVQQQVYLSVANRYQYKILDVALSADYEYNTLWSSMPNFVNPSRHTGLVALAAAVHYKWIKAQASVLGTFVRDEIRRSTDETPRAATARPRFTPAVFFSYQPLLSEPFYLRAFYKHIFRMPTFNDLYYTDLGNIALQPEYTTQYNGGVEYSPHWRTHNSNLPAVDMTIKADGYFNQVKNKIIAVPKGNSQYRWMMMNLGYVEIRGVDINAGVTLHFAHDVDWETHLTYTYQRAQDFTDSRDSISYGGQIAYIPWHSGSVTTRIAWKGLSLNYSFIYVGERYHTSANIPANYELPWYTHDIALGYDLIIKNEKLAIKHCAPRLHFAVEVNNLLNQQYDIVLNYPMPGLNGKVVVKVEF